MGNLSYSRFRNTVEDLKDCQNALAWGEADDLGEEEERAMKRLIRICIEIAQDYGDLDEDD